MSYIITMTGGEEFIDYLRNLPMAIAQIIRDKMSELASRISDVIKNQRLSGQLLNVVTGRLKNSIFSRIYYSKDYTRLSFGSRGDVPYAAIHDVGGTIKAHVIFPSKARVLKFIYGGATAYATRVLIPAQIVPAKNYMDLSGLAPEILEVLAGGVGEGITNR